MHSYWIPAVLLPAIVANSAIGDGTSPPDPVVVEQKIAELERRLETIVGELRALRRQLVPRVLTPQEAYNSFRRHPEEPVTVEFGVAPGWGTRFSEVDYEREPITATWDCFLDDGQTFSVTLTPDVWRALRLPGNPKGAPPSKPLPGDERNAIGKHIEENGLRVTGVLDPDGRSMVVSDPSKVVLYLARQPGTETSFEPSPTVPSEPRDDRKE